MATIQDQLKEFRAAVGKPNYDEPAYPSDDEVRGAARLFAEETVEALSALFLISSFQLHILRETLAQIVDFSTVDRHNLVETAHEFGDVAYVVENLFRVLGVDSKPVVDEIHRANMAKRGGPKRADGKQLKPEGWQPADIMSVLERQIKE